MSKYIGALLFLIWGTALPAAVFTSTDGNVSLELPARWTSARKPAAGAVLSVVKSNARIDIKKVPNCNTEVCLEKKIQSDLAEVKNKKMQVVGNSYTGEQIKRVEFSTGEPFFYISFFTPKNNFSAGYFLINNQGYSILAKDLSYAQADLIFSFIFPAKKAAAKTKYSPASVEMDLASARAYDIEVLPEVQEEILQAPTVPITATTTDDEPQPHARTVGTSTTRWKLRTFITSRMPRYIRYLGHFFDGLVLVVLAYIGLQAVMLFVRMLLRPRRPLPKSEIGTAYPIQFRRRYGTPSLIFRARDNYGNVLMSLTSRWDSLFLFGGVLLMVGAILVIAATGLLEQTRWLALPALTYNTLYTAFSLLIPLGFLLSVCGILWSQLVLRQFALYDNKGQKIVHITQRGFGFRRETYLAYFSRSKEVLFLERKCFSLRRRWKLADKKGHVIAHITEDNLAFALLRKLTGHLWGLLHASYLVETAQGSKGKIENARALYNRFGATMEDPNALASWNLLVAALVINIRDRDKWYPWF